MYGYYKSPFGWFFIFFKNHIQKRVAVKVKGLGFISEHEDNVKPFSFLPPSYNLNDENKIIPVSTLLDGEYGEYGVFSGVPVVLNSEGAKEVVEIEMTEEELKKFKKSNDTIREYISKLNNK